MRIDERFDEDGDAGDPAWASPYIDGAWGRTANPNTVDGELQNLAAFSAGFLRLTGSRRTAAKAVVWLILISTALTILYGVLAIAHVW
jgi:hypothetical protein